MSELVLPLGHPAADDAGRFGAKAQTLARLGRRGLATPGGFVLDAEAYRMQLAALGLDATARQVARVDLPRGRAAALEVKLGLLEGSILPATLAALRQVWCELERVGGLPAAVRSSALVEDRAGASFAGQFESYLGLESEADFLTAVRAAWAALWSTRALRSFFSRDLDPGGTAMGVILQPLVRARVSGGGLSHTAGGHMLVTATWGLGSALAQGQVVPDQYVLGPGGAIVAAATGRPAAGGCAHRPATAAGSRTAPERCLDDEQVAELAGLLGEAEAVVGGPVEIEWALDTGGFVLLQARPLQVMPAQVLDEVWSRHPALSGYPAGIGWGVGRACVVQCECELGRVGPGDVLVTKVAGPALTHILSRVSGVVAELGGSTSHLASLARERGVPMVLGVLDATGRIPDGVQVAVDGVAGIVRWQR